MENKLEQLTRKLYDEGLEKGRAEADRVLAEARKEDDRRPPHARRALFRGIMRLLEQR